MGCQADSSRFKGLDDILTEAFGGCGPKEYDKLVQLIYDLTFPGVLTDDDAERMIRFIDEIYTEAHDPDWDGPSEEEMLAYTE